MILLIDESRDDLSGKWRCGSDWEKHMIQILKLILIFVWNPHGFHVIDAMPEKEIFTPTYYKQNIFVEIVDRVGEK
jgi:hypothetical protein